MSKICVIVPVYNVEKYLNRCINSILKQSFSDFELILIDDGSVDGSPEICDEYANKDSRIHVIHKENGGASSARNMGLDFSCNSVKSEWIVFVDSDDWIHPNTLEFLYNAVTKTNCMVGACAWLETTKEMIISYDDSKAPLNVKTAEDYYLEDSLAVVPWAKIYNSKCFDNIRYPVGKICEDEFVTYKIIYAQPSIAVVDKPLYYYYTNPNSVMNSKWSPKRLVAIEALREQIIYFKNNNHVRSYEAMLQSFVWLLQKNYKYIHREYPEYAEHLPLIRKNMRWAIKKLNYKVSLLTNNNSVIACYEIAYPHFMNLYWYYVACVKKIKKMFKR